MREAFIMDEEWVIIFHTQGETEGYLVKGKLENKGIPVRLSQEAFGKISGLTINGLGDVKVLVPASYKEEAKKVLKEIKKKERGKVKWEKQ